VPAILRVPPPLPVRPALVLARDAAIDACMRFAVEDAATGERGASSIILLHGMPGAGKTTIATEVAERLTKTHHDVVWVEVGQDKARLAGVQTQLARQAGYEGPAFVTEFEGNTILQSLFAGRHCFQELTSSPVILLERSGR